MSDVEVEANAPAAPGEGAPAFAERPTEWIVDDAWRLGGVPLLLAAIFGVVGWTTIASLFLGLGLFVGFFFRNPQRIIPMDERLVVSPADGRVLEAGPVEDADGTKWQRVAIFLSVFNVHVNRAPLAGRVVAIERSGAEYLAAFNRDAETRNVRCDMTLEMADGRRFRVSQITGLIARRIVCHPKVGEWIERGGRYGLIRFGSRTDVWLPVEADLCVRKGDPVRGGSTVLARLPAAPGDGGAK